MPKMTDMIVDIETLGKSHNCVIIQLAALFFDREGNLGKEFTMNINIDSCLKLGMTVDGETISWWFQKKPEALQAVITNPKLLTEVLSAFNNFALDARSVWCHKDFDAPKLNNAFRRCNTAPVYNYKMVKDLRTAVDLGEIDISKFKMDGILHNGLDDCKFEVKYLVEAMKKIKGNKGE